MSVKILLSILVFDGLELLLQGAHEFDNLINKVSFLLQSMNALQVQHAYKKKRVVLIVYQKK
jgi:hypothetical protein